MTIRPVTSRQEWAAFLAARPVPTFLQAWEWGDCQQALGHTMFPLGIYEGSKLIVIALVIKTVAKRGSFLSTSRGPIVDSAWSKPTQYQKVLKELTSYITNLARQEHCAFIRI